MGGGGVTEHGLLDSVIDALAPGALVVEETVDGLEVVAPSGTSLDALAPELHAYVRTTAEHRAASMVTIADVTFELSPLPAGRVLVRPRNTSGFRIPVAVHDELKNAESKQRAIVRAAPIGIARGSLDGRILNANPALCALLGYQEEELVGLSVRDITHRDDAAESVGLVRKIATGELRSFVVVKRHVKKDGNHVWTRTAVTTLRDEDDRPVELLAMLIDISDLKRAEAELEQKSQHLSAMLDAILDLVFRIRSDGTFLEYHAHETSELYVRDPSEIVGRTVAELLPPHVVEIVGGGMARTLAGEDGVAVEYELAMPAGTQYYESRMARCADQEVVSVIQNITEKRLAAQALQEHVDALARSNSDLEQFAYSASHDLREPVRNVSNFVTLLKDEYADQLDDAAQQYIHFAADGARRIDALIRDLLAYSRVGRAGSEPSRLAGAELILEAQANLHQAIEEAEAVITVGDDLPELWGRRTDLIRLFQNLLSNGLKFREPGAPASIEIGSSDGDGEWTLFVRDRGIGLADEYHERVFRLFQRLHTRDEYPGTGVGLAIAKKIVDHHGGRLWFESTPGEATTFFFTLPKKAKPSSSPA